MEPKLNADLSGVRVHTGGDAAAAASGYGARAFTQGNDIHFNAGEFSPGTKEGDRLLAHELTHVVQGQHSGVQRKATDDGEEHGPEVSDPNEPAEKEADAVADKTADELHEGNNDGPEADKKGDKKDQTKQQAPAVAAKLDGVATKIFRAEGGPKQGDHVFNKGLTNMGDDLVSRLAAVTGVVGTDVRAASAAFSAAIHVPAMEMVVSKGAAPAGGDSNSKQFGVAKANFLTRLGALCTAFESYQKASGAAKVSKRAGLAALAASATSALETLFNSCIDADAAKMIPKKDKAALEQGKAAQAAAKAILLGVISKCSR